MGSKNRISLGILTKFVLKYLKIKDKNLYITKKKYAIIKNKHQKECQYISSNNFQQIIDNTIASCDYKKEKGIINFISCIDGRYILYSISNNNYYTMISTIFFVSKKKLKKCQESIIFFDSKCKEEFLKYVIN